MSGELHKIEQALLQRFFDGSFRHDLDIATENQPYEPSIGTPYAEIFVITNDITPFSLKHTNEVDGIFRVILRYPVNDSTKEFKEVAQAILDWFPIGERYSEDGQKVTITKQNIVKGVPEPGWYKRVLTIYWKAFLSR